MFGKSLAAVALGCLAFHTNPDEESFRRYLDDKMKKKGTHWLASGIVSTVTVLAYDRKNFGLFSVVYVSEHRMLYFGAFGMWLPISVRSLPVSLTGR